MRRQTRRHEMRYLVGIPIPYLDRRGKRLRPSQVKSWTPSDSLLIELPTPPQEAEHE